MTTDADLDRGITEVQLAEIEALARNAYWHFNRLEHEYNHYTVISGDQGGHQFPALELRAVNDPQKVFRAFKAFLEALVKS